MRSGHDAARRLRDARLLAQVEGRLRTTSRWRGAMMRTLARLMDAGAPDEGPVRPVVLVLLHFFPDASKAELVALTRLILDVEAEEAGWKDRPSTPS